MKIEESELRKILVEAFESGFYGCKDLQENVVDELVSRVKENNSNEGLPETITINSSYMSSDGSAMVTPWVQHVNPADRRTWGNLPNRNGDVFITSPEVPELQINVETTRIEANPNPLVQDAIRDMQAEEDARFLASVEELTERARVIEQERNNERNDNSTV